MPVSVPADWAGPENTPRQRGSAVRPATLLERSLAQPWLRQWARSQTVSEHGSGGSTGRGPCPTRSACGQRPWTAGTWTARTQTLLCPRAPAQRHGLQFTSIHTGSDHYLQSCMYTTIISCKRWEFPIHTAISHYIYKNPRNYTHYVYTCILFSMTKILIIFGIWPDFRIVHFVCKTNITTK